MGDNISGLVASVLTAIIGVAILAVLVSQNSNTVGVIQSLASGFSSILGVAVSPVTGGGSGGFGGGLGGGSVMQPIQPSVGSGGGFNPGQLMSLASLGGAYGSGSGGGSGGLGGLLDSSNSSTGVQL